MATVDSDVRFFVNLAFNAPIIATDLLLTPISMPKPARETFSVLLPAFVAGFVGRKVFDHTKSPTLAMVATATSWVAGGVAPLVLFFAAAGFAYSGNSSRY